MNTDNEERSSVPSVSPVAAARTGKHLLRGLRVRHFRSELKRSTCEKTGKQVFLD
jgi:hypothetical protein